MSHDSSIVEFAIFSKLLAKCGPWWALVQSNLARKMEKIGIAWDSYFPTFCFGAQITLLVRFSFHKGS